MKFIFDKILIFLGTFMGPIINRILAHFGLAFATYKGFNIFLDTLIDEMSFRLGDLPTGSLQIFMIMNIDVYFSLLFSAITIRYILKPFSNLTRIK